MTFPHESLTYRRSPTMSFSLPGLLRSIWSEEQLTELPQSFSLKAHGCFFLEKDTQKTKPALTECLAIQLCIYFSKTKLHMNMCCPSFAIHPLAEFPSTSRKLCCTCFVMNLHKTMMETSLNHNMCEYNTEKSFTTVGWFAWAYIYTQVLRFSSAREMVRHICQEGKRESCSFF